MTVTPLERIRFGSIERSGAFAQFPAALAQRIFSIVNDYLGSDPAQEAVISQRLGESYIADFFGQIKDRINKYRPNVDDSILNEMLGVLKKIVAASTLSPIELKINGVERENFFLEIAQAWVSIINSSYLFPDDKNAVIRWVQEIPLRYHFFNIRQYGIKPVLLDQDLPYLKGWVKNIVASQKKFEPLLPPIVLQEGDSQGIMFDILNSDNVVCGHLYATIHHLENFPNLQIVTKISKSTQQKLFECAILGTERTLLNKPASGSVDATLVTLGSQRGIANLGLDKLDYPSYMEETQTADGSEMSKTIDPMGDLARYLHEDRETSTLFRIKVIALYCGIIQLAWASTLSFHRKHPISPAQLAVDIERNQKMTENMDHLLQACKELGLENQQPSAKCFFAIGLRHLIPTPSNPASVVELLAQKGWNVKLQQNERPDFPVVSHELTEAEAEDLDWLITKTNEESLFKYQTGR